MESFSMKATSMDEFVDALIGAMKESEANPTIIEMADKVLRPYLRIVDNAQAAKVEIEDLLSASDSMVATMLMNLISRMAPPGDIETAADSAQSMIDHIGHMLSESITQSYSPAPAPTLPPRRSH